MQAGDVSTTTNATACSVITVSAGGSRKGVTALSIGNAMWTMLVGESGLGRSTLGARLMRRVGTCVTVTLIVCLGIYVGMRALWLLSKVYRDVFLSIPNLMGKPLDGDPILT